MKLLDTEAVVIKHNFVKQVKYGCQVAECEGKALLRWAAIGGTCSLVRTKL